MKRGNSPKKEDFELNGKQISDAQFNEYPDYTLGDYINFYYNVYVFLKNGLKNNQRTWPDYITNTEDKTVKANKKLEFYRKIGKIGTVTEKKD